MYQKGIELLNNPTEKAVLWNRLGDVYLQLDDFQDALGAYQMAVELDPENETFKNDLAKVTLGSAHNLPIPDSTVTPPAVETYSIQAEAVIPEIPCRRTGPFAIRRHACLQSDPG